MADATQIKATAAKVLTCLEKVTSFASSIDPIFGVVSSLVGVVRKGVCKEEAHALEKDFQQINDKLESISKKNKQFLKQIRIDEVNENYGKHEERIKHQYDAFTNMVTLVKKDPDNSTSHIKFFEKIYEKDLYDESLNVYYYGVMGDKKLFSRPILDVYLDNCDKDRDIMEHHCAHIAHLFQMGLIALMGYTTVTEDDEDEVREKWAIRVENIQKKMEDVLLQCGEKSS